MAPGVTIACLPILGRSSLTLLVRRAPPRLGGAIWSLPAEDDGGSASAALTRLVDLKAQDISSVQWQLVDGSQAVGVGERQLTVWDLDTGRGSAAVSAEITCPGRVQSLLACARWNPHQCCSQLAAACDAHVRGFDLRSGQLAWAVENADAQLVRDMDFNPNKQYYLATCGDDCRVKFWDIRKPTEPLQVIADHSHWVWTVRFNHFHDQLVLTSSSDWRVLLTSAASLSSEPFGHLLEEDEDEPSQSRARLEDGQLCRCEEHEDSVYAAEWSSADPWTFASLSYDGRLVVSRVPRQVKYKILL
ncbi:EARP and GARP complex-interacting protein 1-like [Pollicipes pollicipes]|uniref:EARP and GARP complex-interacting protein 1-like n=1 Tax=Pollicipes pollicipes TaxID=41117 RepID=UPI0018851EF4|nr:EARP and GARP complex-interacting protein 1-like [Pollicipes pollicipes]